MNNKDLPISQLVQALDLNGQELVPFAKDNANGAFSVALLTSIIREGLATRSSVNGKQNKLIPGYGIEITADNEIRTKLDVSPFKVVEELPTSEIENKVYLVLDPDGEVGKNEYIEYLWVNDYWEIVGKYTAAVDLTPYIKSADAERIYAKKSDIPDTTDFVTRGVVSVLAEQVATLTTQLASVQNKLNTIPSIPLADGKCYALKNGSWVVVADITESIATVTNNDEIAQ